MSHWNRLRASALLILLTAAVPSSLPAQESEGEPGWSFAAELSFVATAGNAESNTIGLSGGAERIWESSRLRLSVGGVRTESSTRTRFAVGSPDDFDLVERSSREKTAENYYARGRYDRDVSDLLFLFGSAGWTRNTFAGFDNRLVLAAGLGNTWVDSERQTFRTDYGVTYTVLDEVVEDPAQKDRFGGFQVGYEYDLQVTDNTRLESRATADDSFDELEDVRVDWLNALTVSISEALAIKTSVLLQWDNLPSLTAVELQDPVGTPTGETVLVPLDELDSLFTVALVLNL